LAVIGSVVTAGLWDKGHRLLLLLKRSVLLLEQLMLNQLLLLVLHLVLLLPLLVQLPLLLVVNKLLVLLLLLVGQLLLQVLVLQCTLHGLVRDAGHRGPQGGLQGRAGLHVSATISHRLGKMGCLPDWALWD
jgi:hypothetical protein